MRRGAAARLEDRAAADLRRLLLDGEAERLLEEELRAGGDAAGEGALEVLDRVDLDGEIERVVGHLTSIRTEWAEHGSEIGAARRRRRRLKEDDR